MKMSRVLFLSVSLLISVPVLFAEGAETPVVEISIEKTPTVETTVTETPVAEATTEETPSKLAQFTGKAKDLILSPWNKSVEKAALAVAAVAASSWIKDNFVGKTLVARLNGISKALVVTAAAAASYGAYQVYQSLNQEEEVIDFDLYDFNEESN